MDADRTRRAASFEQVAEIYERARPGYPTEAVSWLVDDARRVLDLAAGTGKLTRALVAEGRDVVAVDPSGAMLDELRRSVPAAEALVGTAEAIPLPDASVEAVTVAQAFHWFDYQPALSEIARVLRPGGRLGLVWNVRDERVRWAAQLGEIIGSERLNHLDLGAMVAASGLFAPLEQAAFAHAQRVDRGTLLDLVASRSDCATRDPAEHADILTAVGRLFDEAATDGPVDLPYVVEAYRTDRV